MTTPLDWTKDAYNATATSDVWWYTPYDKGAPGYWDNVSRDAEMRGIVAMELALDAVPGWARAVGIGHLPPCGHYTFPAPLLQVLDLIGAADQATVDRTGKIQCYTADRARKRTAQDICLCLDAWLAGAGPEAPAAELNALGFRKIDWPTACTGLWEALDERSEKKALLVERVLLGIRDAVKTFRWGDESATEFGRDEYLAVPTSPRVQALEDRLRELDPRWGRLFKIDLGAWWLCAPNAFRLLEYDLWAIGHDRPAQPGEPVPKFLRSDDTCPSRRDAAVWWPSFLAALDAWWRDCPAADSVADDVNRRLGSPTPIKRWLVRLYLRKLRMLASYEGEGLSKLVGYVKTR